MNLTFNQKIAYVVAALSFLAAGGSTADIVTIFGPVAAKIIIAVASLGAGLGGIFLGMVTGQANLVKDVRSMPGVETITVNKKANPTLAAIAVDPDEDKVAPVEGDEAVVQKIADSK